MEPHLTYREDVRESDVQRLERTHLRHDGWVG
jgi:hypothetical protein